MSNLKIVQVKVSELIESEYNPRHLSQKAEYDLTNSIKRFGLLDPVIINSAPNRKNIIIGGYQRFKIAKKLGYKTIPAIEINLPDIKKEKELNLRLNKNTGEFDLDLLKNFDIDLLLETGFDDSDLSAIWDEALEIEDDDFDIEKSIKEHQEPKTKTGDLYKLGDHFLLCGDATSLTDIKRLVGNHLVDMVYTDSPFNISLNYSNGIGTKGKYGATKTNDSKSAKEFHQFLYQAISNAIAVSKPNAHYFYYMDQNWIWLIQQLYQKLGIKHKRVCLWIKNNFNVTPNTAFNKCYESVIYGTRGNPYINPKITNLNEVLNKEIGTGNRLHDDILDLFEIWLVKRKAGQEYLHPTEKLPLLHEKALRRCTKPGDIVLDTFAGSGSTLIACEQLKRKCFLLEIDPIFCNVIISRYQKLTQKEAILCK